MVEPLALLSNFHVTFQTVTSQFFSRFSNTAGAHRQNLITHGVGTR
jgi:hypothetical protein